MSPKAKPSLIRATSSLSDSTLTENNPSHQNNLARPTLASVVRFVGLFTAYVAALTALGVYRAMYGFFSRCAS